MGRRRRALALLVAVCALGAPGPAAGAARPRVLGGPVVTNAADAPWQVLIVTEGSTESTGCSGSLIDATHVLTAAHCTYANLAAGTAAAPSAVTVSAGLTDTSQTPAQKRAVSATRRHPGYVPNADSVEPDDVAVLQLASALDLSASTVSAIPLAAIGDGAAPGTAVRAYGWGQTTEGTNSTKLHRFDGQVVSPDTCSDFTALTCIVGQGQAECKGDSGSGMVSQDGRPRLVAVNTSGRCTASTPSYSMDVSQHEIGDFIRGNDSPPRAPRPAPSTFPTLSGAFRAGGVLACAAPAYTPAATSLTYTFLSDSGATLQSGAGAQYTLADADVGHAVSCDVVAASDAGRTLTHGENVVVGPPVDPALSFTATGRHLTIRSSVPASTPLTYTVAVKSAGGAVVATQTSAPGTVPTLVPRVSPGHYQLCITTPRTGIYLPGSACGAYTAVGTGADLVKIGRRRRHGTRYTVTLHVAKALVGRRVSITWSSRKGTKGRLHTLARRRVKLHSSLTLRSPGAGHHRTLFLSLRLPTVRSGGLSYRGGSFRQTVGKTR